MNHHKEPLWGPAILCISLIIPISFGLRILFTPNPQTSPKSISPVPIIFTTHPQAAGYSDREITFTVTNPTDAPLNLIKLTADFSATPTATITVYRDTNSNRHVDSLDELIGDLKHTKWKPKSQRAVSELHTKDITAPISKTVYIPSHQPATFILSSSQFLAPFGLDATVEDHYTGTNLKSTMIRAIDDATFQKLPEVWQNTEDFTKKHPEFIVSRQNTNELYLQGEHIFKDTVMIPATCTVKILPGTVVKLYPGISFISYGKVIAQGTSSRPILFTKAQATPRGTVAIVGKQASGSEFDHVIVEEGSEVSVNGMFFSGGLAAHYANVTIKNSLIRRNHGDDGINIKHARALVANNQFIDNFADGLDTDVITGEIKNNTFTRNGNDGMDISFTSVDITGNKVDGSGDKCISVGEKSYPHIFNNDLQGCQYGVAVKDGSNVLIESNRIMHNVIGIGAYQKKPIYAFPELTTRNNTLQDNQQETEYQLGTTIHS